jgi:hypothetical protein
MGGRRRTAHGKDHQGNCYAEGTRSLVYGYPTGGRAEGAVDDAVRRMLLERGVYRMLGGGVRLVPSMLPMMRVVVMVTGMRMVGELRG